MKKIKIAQIVPLVLLAGSSFAQGDNKAVPRGSGGGSSDAGSRHAGGGGSSSSSSSGSGSSSSSGGSSASSGGRYDSSAPDAAQRRPRPGTGTGTRDRYGNDRDRYNGYPNSYYYYDPYAYSWGYSRPYGSYGYGYGYRDYGYSYGDYYGYSPSSSYRSYRYRSGNIAPLRTMVEPAKARVYVDGYYAGIAADFDGLFQRLNVSPGRHDITFRLEGYKSHTFAVYANRDQTLKLRLDMVRGDGETRDTAGEETDRDTSRDNDRARDREDEADRDSARDDRDNRNDRRDSSREVDSDRTDRRYEPSAAGNGERGELLLSIEPPDASVYIDGEFYGKAAQVTRLELPAGRHRVEVVRPGYKTEETEVEIEREARKVVVKLERR